MREMNPLLRQPEWSAWWGSLRQAAVAGRAMIGVLVLFSSAETCKRTPCAIRWLCLQMAKAEIHVLDKLGLREERACSSSLF